MVESKENNPKSNALEFSVSELSQSLKRMVEDQFGHVRVRGEISGYRGPHSSGHSYFSIKDEKARIEAVIWRGQASKMKFLPEEGMEVIASGKLTTYPGSSKYQIVIDNLEPAGAGALMALLEERKKKLTAEGLFDEARKQLLPFMPKRIGVITSPTGAVIRDVLHRITDRFPLHVLVWPVRVQGDTCGKEVANAVRGFNALDGSAGIDAPDLIIVARGGGSLEDLWGFNDESVVRAAADSNVPLISAVGHETDWTLMDLVADWRAPTPTAAAEKAVPVRADLAAYLADISARLKRGLTRTIDSKKQSVISASRGLLSPDQLLAMPRRRFDEAERRLGQALLKHTQIKHAQYDRLAVRITPANLKRRIGFVSERLELLHGRLLRAQNHNFEKRSNNFNQITRLLSGLSYQGVLERGFALVLDEAKCPIRSAINTKDGEHISIRFKDGTVAAQIGEIKSADKPRNTSAKPVKVQKKQSIKDDTQGSLF